MIEQVQRENRQKTINKTNSTHSSRKFIRNKTKEEEPFRRWILWCFFPVNAHRKQYISSNGIILHFFFRSLSFLVVRFLDGSFPAAKSAFFPSTSFLFFHSLIWSFAHLIARLLSFAHITQICCCLLPPLAFTSLLILRFSVYLLYL